MDHNTYTVGWICALPIERAAAVAMLDECHESLPQDLRDPNNYTLGRIGPHNVVVACLPSGLTGVTSAARVAEQMRWTFTSLRLGLMVGIGGGAPSQEHDIRLGDVVVSTPTDTFGGVIQYDFGKTVKEGLFQRTSSLNRPPIVLLNAVSSLRARHMIEEPKLLKHLSDVKSKYPKHEAASTAPGAHQDQLFEADFDHTSGETTCANCQTDRLVTRPFREDGVPAIHYGLIASANQVMRDGKTRERLRRQMNVLCFEMEAAGLMDDFSYLVIRGICDYADSHKNKLWQPYAAMTAAAYAKELLNTIPASQVVSTRIVGQMTTDTARSNRTIVLPHLRNSDFVERRAIIDELDRCLASKKHGYRRAALCGLGGVGKTQIALEYAYGLMQSLPQCSVFWVYASSVARFEETYRRIARDCQIPGFQDPKADVMQLVRDWLESKQSLPWLMIIDNVDDTRILSHVTANQKYLLEYIPQSLDGSIIFTTRNKDIATDLVRDPIDVSLMDFAEARSLVHKKVTGASIDASSDDTELKTFLEMMEYLPLAITQAASYMTKRRISITQYLALFRQSDSSTITLLSHEFTDHARESRPMESAAKTWMISFQYIRSQNSRSAELLSLMSFLDRHAIPNSLLVRKNEDLVNFLNAMGMLEALCLVYPRTDNESHDMHRLVQLTTRAWLSEHGDKAENWALLALENLSERFPEGEYEHWVTCASYMPHVDMVLQHDFNEHPGHANTARATLLCNTSKYLRSQGSYESAVEKAKSSVRLREDALGPTHPDTLESMDTLARALLSHGMYNAAQTVAKKALTGREETLGHEHKDTLVSCETLTEVLLGQGKYEAAEQACQRVVAGRRKVLGPENRLTLSSICLLGWILRFQRKYTEAKSHVSQVSTIQESLFGKDHPDTLISLGRLAALLLDLGDASAAEELYREIIGRSRVVFGEEHPESYVFVNNLAVVLSSRAKYEEAEKLDRKGLERKTAILGSDHPDTLVTLNNLGYDLSGQGKRDQAEAIFWQALEARQRVLGMEHVDTLNTADRLADELGIQGKHSAAESMYRRALEGRERTLGPEHADTLASVNNVGVALHHQTEYEAAEAMYRRALEGKERTLGSEHADTLTGVNNLGVVLYDQKKYEAAEAVHRRAMEGREKALGPEDADTLTSVNNLGGVLHDQKKYKEAEALYRRAIEGREKTLGPEHADTLITTNSMGVVLHDQKKYEAAEVMYRRVLEKREKILGSEHADTLASVNNMGVLLHDQKKYEVAEAMYRQAWEMREKTLGSEHADTLSSANNIGVVLFDQKKYEAAEAMYRRVLEGREKTLGPEHRDTLVSVNNIAVVLHDQKKYAAAEAMYRRALEGREKTLGPEHADTLTSINNMGIVLRVQKKDEAAEKMYRRALKGREKTLGPNHIDTFTSMGELGCILRAQGHNKAAEQMHRRALSGFEKNLGPDHSQTLLSANNLGVALLYQKKYEAAEEILRGVLEKRQTILGFDHEDTLSTADSLAMGLYEKKDFQAAEEICRLVLKGKEKRLGAEHPDTIASRTTLAELLRDRTEHEAAHGNAPTGHTRQNIWLGGLLRWPPKPGYLSK